MFNQQQIYLFGQIQTSQTGGQLYSGILGPSKNKMVHSSKESHPIFIGEQLLLRYKQLFYYKSVLIWSLPMTEANTDNNGPMQCRLFLRSAFAMLPNRLF